MKKNLAGTIKAEDDASDALSTSTNNSGQHSGADNNLARLENFNSEEFETLCDGSKKIRKKRNAYQKIDDGVRLKLLEAVKHGETLKSAAKKFKINYSSAKSILHTYRKEGRILKKSAQERNIKRNPTAGGEMGEDGSPHQSDNENNEEDQEFKENFKGRSEVQQMEAGNRKSEGGKVEAMNNGQDLVDNLVNILKMNGNRSMSADNGKVQGQSLKVTKVASKPARMEEEQKVSVAAGNNEAPVSGNMQSPTSLIHLTQMLQGNSMEKFKMLDNIFANISNSPFPIVTKAIKAYTDSSGSKTEGAEKELELSEEVNNSQNQPKQSDEICMPHPLRFNTAQLLQERVENKLNNEDPDWDVTIENAAIDTFKSFMDAQLLLCDALKKASYLNSLMQAQKAKTEGSLVQGQIQSLNNA